MKIAIINGSSRQQAQSLKVAGFVEDMLLDKGLCDEVYRFDLTDNPLPLWDESIWSGSEEWKKLLNPVSEELADSDGFVVIVPEWHGMAPSALKNFFLMWGKGELAHKPALIVSVSSGDGGAYPVAELRMSSYKNNRICYIPEQLIIRHVESVLNDEGDNNPDADAYFRARSEYALKILREYAIAMKSIRASGVTFDERFKNGM